MTPRIIQHCNALTGYDTYPHVDMYERAREAAEILVRSIRQGLRPSMALSCPPLLTPLQTQVTTREIPMKRLIDLVPRSAASREYGVEHSALMSAAARHPRCALCTRLWPQTSP